MTASAPGLAQYTKWTACASSSCVNALTHCGAGTGVKVDICKATPCRWCWSCSKRFPILTVDAPFQEVVIGAFHP